MYNKFHFGIAICLISLLLISCGGKGSDTSTTDSSTPKALNQKENLNISIFLDLSDRIKAKPTKPYKQTDNDIALIGHIADYFRQATVGSSILKSKNKLKVFFYPTPNDPTVCALADSLHINIATLQGVNKRAQAERLHEKLVSNISPIYEKAILENKWVGSDIWDFFSSGQVKRQCIEKDMLNVLVIFTDGYLYHANNTITKNDSVSYITSKALRSGTQKPLIVKQKGLDNLHVLVLEVDPFQPAQRDPMKEIIGKWLQEMGVEHYDILTTDLTTNTKPIIDNFFKKLQ